MGCQKQRDLSRGILPALTLALAILSITLAGTGSVLAQSPFQTSFKVGDPAPDFDVQDLDGAALKLSALRGKVVVLNFWFIACPPCRAEMPALNQLVQHFEGREVVFIGFAADPSDALRDFLQTHEFEYQVVPDATPIAELYVVRGAPTHVVIDQDGRFAKIVYGAIGDVQTALEEPISPVTAEPVTPHESIPQFRFGVRKRKLPLLLSLKAAVFYLGSDSFPFWREPREATQFTPVPPPGACPTFGMWRPAPQRKLSLPATVPGLKAEVVTSALQERKKKAARLGGLLGGLALSVQARG